MAYFTAVIARHGQTWRARDVDLEDAGSFEALVDALRVVASGDEPVLAVVEHEDEWFALVRVDGDDDPRLFVSDIEAAARGAYAEVLVPPIESLALVGPAGSVSAEAVTAASDGDAPVAPPMPTPSWAGEPDLLADLEVPGDDLQRLVADHPDDPASVLAEVGEAVGFGDLLDALR